MYPWAAPLSIIGGLRTNTSLFFSFSSYRSRLLECGGGIDYLLFTAKDSIIDAQDDVIIAFAEYSHQQLYSCFQSITVFSP